MTDWTAFGVDFNQTGIFQNGSYFSIGENLVFPEFVNTERMINVNATAASNTNVSYTLSSLGFGIVNYPTVAGLLSPVSQYMQLLYSSAVSAVFTPAFRGIGLPAAAWNTFSNLMEVLTKGQFDCATEMMDGVNYGFCVAYAPCSAFSNVWKFAFQVNFLGGANSNYINVPLSTFAYDYVDEENSNF